MNLYFIIYWLVGFIICARLLYLEAERLDMGMAILNPWFWLIAMVEAIVWPIVVIYFLIRKFKRHA
jgi:hypothetical protein